MTGFLGKYLHQLDEKGRLALPASYRRRVGDEGFVLVHCGESALFLYPAAAWKGMEQRLLELVQRNPDTRPSVLALAADAVEAVPDKQGRILIPERLQRAAQLDGETLIVGMLDKIEIWNPELFESTTRMGSPESEKYLRQIFSI